jgi:epoxyqueuosine reductase
MEHTVKMLFEFIEQKGWKGQIVPVAHLTDLRKAICGYYERGLIDETLYQSQLDFLSFDPPEDLPDVRSVIIVAMRTPQMRVFFHWQGESVPVIIPPTYVSYTSRTENVQNLIAGWLRTKGYHLKKTYLPLKTLAVRSGLARYGRNNISYVPAFGSFMQLVGAFTDLPCDTDPWREPVALERCNTCVACLRHCPTGAISDDRFLLHAELCLTYHNEATADFPDWIDPSWHHCLVGCMRCQTVCPENKAVINFIEDRAAFTEEETILFIRHTPFDKLPAKTVTKYKNLEINENYHSLCRNLSMIIRE